MENKTEQFLMVPYTILQNKELKDSDKMTLALIYSFHNNNKEVYISNNKLGFMLGVSRTTASERVTKLEALGYIKCERVMINGKERRTIVPLKMVGEPKPLVGTPNLLVGNPNGISRYSDTSLVGGVGSIIYPILDNELDNLPHKVLNNKNPVELNQFEKEIVINSIKNIKAPENIIDISIMLIKDGAGVLTRKQKDLILENKKYFNKIDALELIFEQLD